MTVLARYVRHAELYGFDADYFEIAARDLGPLDLGRLNLRLQRLDPKWRLPQDVARALAIEIVGAGESPAWACRAAGCSRRTLNRALSDVVQVPECAPEPAFLSGEKWTKQPTLGAGSNDADLSTARAAYAAARAAYERAAREGDWDAVRELVKPAAVAANRASALHDERRRVAA